MKVLVTPTSLQPGKNDKALEPLRAFADNLVFNSTGKPLREDDLIPLLKDCDGYIAGLDSITEKVLAACPRLKVISRYGAGVDRVDLAAAKARNIAVTNTPGANAEAVGELALTLMLSVARQVPYLDRSTKEGGWLRTTGMELKGKALGVMGLGSIGKVLARSAQGLEMTVLAYDPYINADYCAAHAIRPCAFEEVLREADVISLHLPLNDETHHLIDDRAIRQMKPAAVLINTSRGGIIDEEAALAALKEGRLGGLGLDAFEAEPPKDSPLFAFPNVVATPHTGAHTREATDNMARMAVENLIDVLSGKDCPYLIR